MPSLSHTRAVDFRDCQAFDFVTRVEGLRAPNSAERRLGVLAHAAIASQVLRYCASLGIAVEGPTDPLAAIRKAIADEKDGWREKPGDRSVEEDAELALHLCDRTMRQLRLESGRFEPVLIDGKPAVELKLRVPLPPDLSTYFDKGFAFIIDWLARDREYEKRLAIIDFKVSNSLGSEDGLDLDTQLATYQHLLGELGYWPELAWQYRIRDKWAKKPALLSKRTKGRMLSVQGAGMIDEATFREACAEVGDDPDSPAYADFLEAVRTTQTLYRCVLGGVDRARAAAIWQEILETGRQIKRVAEAGPEAAVRNHRSFQGSACKRCSLYHECYQALGTRDLARRYRARLESPSPQTETPTITLEDLDVL